MQTFTIRPDPTIEARFTLHVFKTRKQMNAYIAAWRKKRGLEDEGDHRAAGMLTPRGSREFPTEGTARWYTNDWATMFLNEEDLRENRYELIAHEALHCALSHERNVQHFIMDYGNDSDMEDEERLCYLHGRIVKGIYMALRNKGK
jgi:hypothetical protein